MSPTRRNAALGLLAAAAAAPGARALAQPAEIGAEPIELPDEDQPNTSLDTTRNRNEHMLAPVTINNQGPFNFLLDTGANVSCVSHRLMERLELKSAESAAVHTMVGVRHRPIVILDRLQVGPRDRRRVRAPALPIDAGVDGILGVDWLKGQRLVLDFKGNKMEIVKSKRDVNEPGRVAVVPARRRHGQLTIVDADLSGKRISAIIDSGAQGSLCNRKLRDIVHAAEARKGQLGPPRYVRMETVAGETFTGESLFLPFLRLGGLHLGNVGVTYADMHVFDIWGLKDTPALVIGMDLLSQFEDVALDFGRSAVRFAFT
ncbi:retroviral-like aspartic protease family protein [uncultured Phenylobacterium sp.]|uniref:retroviral-like aspartic protease family protein n=1 Tax=uncultured Phenylobacterium sp. TaxID=349273 RepID=UPI0025E05700|nr:retroviral-like aspartic protease family protein [uncultured Phenylobacterium sp.]